MNEEPRLGVPLIPLVGRYDAKCSLLSRHIFHGSIGTDLLLIPRSTKLHEELMKTDLCYKVSRTTKCVGHLLD